MAFPRSRSSTLVLAAAQLYLPPRRPPLLHFFHAFWLSERGVIDHGLFKCLYYFYAYFLAYVFFFEFCQEGVSFHMSIDSTVGLLVVLPAAVPPSPRL